MVRSIPTQVRDMGLLNQRQHVDLERYFLHRPDENACNRLERLCQVLDITARNDQQTTAETPARVLKIIKFAGGPAAGDSKVVLHDPVKA